MKRVCTGVNRRRLMAALAGIAVLGACAACAASQESSAPQGAQVAPAPAGGQKEGVGAPMPESGPPPPQEAQRDVVKTASLTVEVPNTSEAADEAAVAAERVDGRVDNRSEDAGSDGGFATTSIVLRVPVADLDGVVRELKGLGKVQTAVTNSEDVTAQRVDLDARIKALQTSVDRLLAIIRDARDSDALIKAEDALSERQADLDSLRAQRDQLGDQIAYSTVDVTFVADQLGGPAPKQYDGFTGQIERGWDGMVFIGNGLVMTFGLLLPWLGALAVVAAIAYGTSRVVQGRRS